MVSFTDRLKAKLRKDAPTVPRAGDSPVTVTPHAQAVPDPASTSPTTISTPERLWNRAYEHAKAQTPSTVDAYERILSVRLLEHNVNVPNGLASQQNGILQNADGRRTQMQQLVQHGLRNTESDARVKQCIDDGMQAVMAVKDVMDLAVLASPEAAVAWVGVCFALEILMNPLSQASSNRQGIAYVVSRMEWYWNLSSLLLDENMTETHSREPRCELEEVVTQLYAKLLLYQMKSVCYYHRSRFATVMRDLIKLENWDGELSDIQAAEAAVQADSTQYNTASIRARLGTIAETAKSQNAKLDSINSAVREQTQQQQKMHETSEYNRCLADLRLTDPRDDKKRIEETKGGLLKDAYHWVLDHPDFRQWRHDAQHQLLWVKADPGKGKTMLLCGIIDELQKTVASNAVLAYFFCQATDSRINNAIAVLRGLLYMLVSQQPSLLSHVRGKYDHAGKSLFEDANAWVALAEIFDAILRDPDLNTTFLIIDALDECVIDLSKLLSFIAKHTSASSRVKWIVSSRNWPEIEAQLEQAGHKVQLSLELNEESVSAAVGVFIQQRVSQLAQQNKYDKHIKQAVLDHFTLNANDTFLWVALVCINLQMTAKRNVLKKLGLFPPGLDALYKQMMQQISKSDDAELCKQVLAFVALVYRPITLEELVALVEELEDLADDPTSIREIISLCGSFLTIRGKTVYFVHQSAKDFLLANAASEMFPSGMEEVHHSIFARSLKVMSATLRRDMYGLKALGYSANSVETPDLDPLAASRYSCVYWIDHLCDSSPTSHVEDLQDRGFVDLFFRKHYLHWLEALSLCKNMLKGVVSVRNLQMKVQAQWETTPFTELVYDAYRFIMDHKEAISSSPLQVYASALLFSPTGSLIRRLYKHEEPEGITIKPAMSDSWSACLQTLEGHTKDVTFVAFSQDSSVASAARDGIIKIWDAISGACLQTLKGHEYGPTSVAFSQDSTQLASASHDMNIKIWDTSSGACLQTLKSNSKWITCITFSHSTQLVSGSHDGIVEIWDTSSGVCLQTFEAHSKSVTSVSFLHDFTQLVTGSEDSTIKIWDTSSGVCLQTLEGHTDVVFSAASSRDSAKLASGSEDMTVKIWDTSSGACLQTLQGHNHWVTSVAFLQDSTQLASGSGDSTIKIWDTSNGTCLQTLQSHSGPVTSVAFSYNSAQLASASHDNTVKIWDTSSACLQRLESHRNYITSITFSHDSTQLVSTSSDGTIKIWDVSSGACLRTLEGHAGVVDHVALSPTSTQLASASQDTTVKIWDTSGACLQTLEGHSSWVLCVAYSHDSTQLASGSRDSTVKIWDTSSGACLQTLQGHNHWFTSVAFSHDSTQVASGSGDSTIKIWDTSGACLQTLEGHSNWISCVAFSQDSSQLASGSQKSTIKIWDLSSGACLQTLHTKEPPTELSFDSTGSLLYTEIGAIDIQSSEVSSKGDAAEPERYSSQDTSLSSDKMWIQHAGNNVLWIPTEFRPLNLSVRGPAVGMGVRSGRVWMCKIDL